MAIFLSRKLISVVVVFGGLLVVAKIGFAEIVVTDCYVSPLNDVDVPAEAQGVIRKLHIDEGYAVKEGQSLANIDDREAQINRSLAEIELEKSQEQAANDVRIRYAKEDAKVSKAELDAALEANALRPGAFGATEMRKMELQFSRSTLGIEQAELEQKELAHTVRANEAKFDAANDEIDRRNITSPFNGVVAEIRIHKGEWVNPGDAVLRLVQMDRLSIDGFLNVNKDRGEVRKGMPVIASVDTGVGKVEAHGTISFISPIVQAGGEYRIRVEVPNLQKDGQWVLRPGLPATFRIQDSPSDPS
jgi:multidrug efflux pump subunit AcrA (membrane-fusion protein)